MSVAELLRMLQKTKPGWIVCTSTTTADKERIDKMFVKFVQPEVDHQSEHWQIRPTRDGKFKAARFGRKTLVLKGTLEELEQLIEAALEKGNDE